MHSWNPFSMCTGLCCQVFWGVLMWKGTETAAWTKQINYPSRGDVIWSGWAEGLHIQTRNTCRLQEDLWLLGENVRFLLSVSKQQLVQSTCFSFLAAPDLVSRCPLLLSSDILHQYFQHFTKMLGCVYLAVTPAKQSTPSEHTLHTSSSLLARISDSQR